MKHKLEDDLTTYWFTGASIGCFLWLYSQGEETNALPIAVYGFIGCIGLFVYQIIKLILFKKHLKNEDEALLKKISKNTGTINTIQIFNNVDLFEKSKSQKVQESFDLTRKGILLSFYSVMVLIGMIVYHIW